MEKSTSRFLMGLGVGSMLGAIMYRCSQSAKAKEWKKKMCCAAQSAAEKAGEWVTNAKERAAEMGQKAAEAAADKAEDAKNKFNAYTK